VVQIPSGNVEPSWITESRVAIVAGKGGVGSTTVAAAMAMAAARAGADVLFVAVDGRPGVGPLLGGQPLTHEAEVLTKLVARAGGGTIRGRTMPPEGAFADYLELKKVPKLVRRAASAASLDVLAAATPGLEHLLVLGKIKELERQGVADLIVVDAPPAGHAAPFLRSPSALLEVVTDGSVREQAEEVSAMLADRARSQAVLVTLPEETPVNELIELAIDVDERLGLALAPLVLNACWAERSGLEMSARTAARSQGAKLPRDLEAALAVSNRFGRARLEQQREQIARLDEQLGLPRVLLPRLITPQIGPADLERIVDALVTAPELRP
jgi:arsenite/tail-anchored protein-transporting ATPase